MDKYSVRSGIIPFNIPCPFNKDMDIKPPQLLEALSLRKPDSCVSIVNSDIEGGAHISKLYKKR